MSLPLPLPIGTPATSPRTRTPRDAAAHTHLTRVRLSIGEFDALHAARVTMRFPPHAHDVFAIGVIEDGANRLRYRGANRLAGTGAVVAIPPGELHTGEPTSVNGWTYRMIYPTEDFVRMASGDDAGHRPIFFAEPVIDDPGLARRFVALHNQLLAPACSLERESSLLRWISVLVRRHGSGAAEDVAATRSRGEELAARARAYLEAHYASPVRLADLAAACEVSAFHLIRTFRRVVGVPPHAWLKQLRVARAQAMLQRGASVTTAAYACGFSDQSHLTRTFKSVLGVPPGAYVRSVRAAAY